MNKDNFLLYDNFNKALSEQEFELAKAAYMNLLAENKYCMKETHTIYELIESIKRTPEKIGPYQNISVFEALNRIGSDLVLLSGATQLFKEELKGIKPQSIHLKMGSTRGFDFEVFLNDKKVIYGEAFNAAESFCKEKMRQAIIKLIDNKDGKTNSAIVFVNDDVKNTLEKYIKGNHQLQKNPEFELNIIYCTTNKP